jgi:hypothetical protein
MDWLQISEDFVGGYGWGIQGRYMRISRMFVDQDKMNISKDIFLASYRPRGILSGFLAIVPTLNHAVFIPPPGSKQKALRIRIRLSDSLWNHGAVFSAYLTRDKQVRIEDILVWQGKDVWSSETFSERWEHYVKPFFESQFKQDPELQGVVMKPVDYINLQSLKEPTDIQIVEFIPNHAGSKRIIWMPTKTDETPTKTATIPYRAKKESSIGPDVYSLWKGEERLGLALIRTLDISRALRLANLDEMNVEVEWNKQFEKWEIKSILK